MSCKKQESSADSSRPCRKKDKATGLLKKTENVNIDEKDLYDDSGMFHFTKLLSYIANTSLQ